MPQGAQGAQGVHCAWTLIVSPFLGGGGHHHYFSLGSYFRCTVYDVQSRIVASAGLRHVLLEPPAQGTKPAGGPHEDVCQATYTQSDITGAAHYN